MDKLGTVREAMNSLNKQYGKGTLMFLGEEPDKSVEVIPSGCISLDYIMGIGGFPRGRIIEIFGPESSGKTTLALHTIAETQKRGGTCAFIDVEHALDMQYAERLGVDIKELFVSQPDYGEQALEIVNTLTATSAIDLIIIDSVAALVPKSEIEGEMGQATMAVQARLMSQAMRKLNGIVAKTKTTLIFINQLRSKIGVMYGSPETTTGGNALKFYASVRIDIRRISTIKVDNAAMGSRTRLKVVKSKVSPPFKEIETDVLYNEGISKYSEVFEFGVSQSIIKKSGAWYEYQEDRYNGKNQVVDALKKNEILFEMLRQEILEKLKIPRNW